MRISGRDLAVPAAVAALGSLLLAWMGLLTPAFTDYETEAETALLALRDGRVGDFVAQLPAYGGSLVLRAPFVLLTALWGGGDLSVYRSVAAPCVAAGVLLGVFLWARARRMGSGSAAAWLALCVCAINPITLRALEVGHPEELLGAALCVGAALAAGARRPLLAGLLLGLAIGNKQWAVLAVVPVTLMLDQGRRRALAVAGAVAAVLFAPVLLHAGTALSQTTDIARQSGGIFQPWQVFWFLGDHGEVVRGLFGEKPGYRTGPGWVSQLSHPLVVAVPLAVSLLCAGRLRRAPWHDGLLLLALVFLLRCLLDTWNTSYYSLPFLLALVAWEVHERRGLPLLAGTATLLSWVSFGLLPDHVSADAQAFFYLGWSVPLAAGLGWRLFAPARFEHAASPLGAALRRRLPTLARALG